MGPDCLSACIDLSSRHGPEMYGGKNDRPTKVKTEYQKRQKKKQKQKQKQKKHPKESRLNSEVLNSAEFRRTDPLIAMRS